MSSAMGSPMDVALSVVGTSGYTAGSGSLTVRTGDGAKFSTSMVIAVASASDPSLFTMFAVGAITGDTLSVSVIAGTTDRNYASGAPVGTAVFNVRAFGAKGDGVADDTAAINVAIAAAPEGNVVYFPPGRYLTTDTMVVAKDLSLRGPNGTIHNVGPFGANWDAPGYQSGAVILSTMTSGYVLDCTSTTELIRVHIEGVSLVGLGDATRTTTGLRMGPGGSVACFMTLRSVRTANFATGIELNVVENSTVDDVWVFSCETGMLCTANTNANTFTNFNVHRCGTGLRLVGATKNVFLGGAIQACGVGVKVESSAEENSVRDVYFENPAATYAVHVAGDSFTLDSCHFGTSNDNIRIEGNGCRIFLAKYMSGTLTITGLGTLVVGKLNGTLNDLGTNTTYLANGSSAGLIAPALTAGTLNASLVESSGDLALRSPVGNTASLASGGYSVGLINDFFIPGGTSGGPGLGSGSSPWRFANITEVRCRDVSLSTGISDSTAVGTFFFNSLFLGSDHANKLCRLDGSGVVRVIEPNTGTAVVASGTTSVQVAHGLGATPSLQNVTVTPTNSMGAAAKFWVSAADATNLTISVDSDPGVPTAAFAWSAVLR